MHNKMRQSESPTCTGTTEFSERHSQRSFKPAFLDKSTGRIEIARLANGQPAPAHFIDWLPDEWAMSFHRDGTVKSLKQSVVAGFVYDAVFYTRDQAEEL